jgi:pSer/pThr/pTyr-binding forkhead associated (FHA) protein
VSDGVIAVANLIVLGLLYLFFVRVMRAMWVELYPQGTRRKPTGAKPQPPVAASPTAALKDRSRPRALTIIAGIDNVGTSLNVDEAIALGEITVGRGLGCTIVLTDSYASQVHARFFAADNQLWVDDLGSTNGSRHNEAQLSRPTPFKIGDRLTIGATVIEGQR